ncbi:MAG: RcnB family protein [Phycisphaerales bacterium]|nr:RcnB family protein [Hyphomonadaceae bacterium]
MLVGPLAATASAQTAGQVATQAFGRGDNDDRRDRDDRRGDRYDRDDRRGDRRGDNDNRGDRYDRDDRRGDRDNRRQQRWDNQRHNGYSYNGRWNYGPPPAHYEGRRGYEAGYRTWRRGERLPSYYQTRYRTVDYRREHLRAPPRGYRYVEDDRGDMLLVGIATGVILSIILSQ